MYSKKKTKHVISSYSEVKACNICIYILTEVVNVKLGLLSFWSKT